MVGLLPLAPFRTTRTSPLPPCRSHVGEGRHHARTLGSRHRARERRRSRPLPVHARDARTTPPVHRILPPLSQYFGFSLLSGKRLAAAPRQVSGHDRDRSRRPRPPSLLARVYKFARAAVRQPHPNPRFRSRRPPAL